MTVSAQRILFAGDCLPSRPFHLPDWIPGGLVAGNLEALVSRAAATSQKAYAVRLGPESARYLEESGFAAFNVANNHVYDAGPAAFEEMMDILSGVGGIEIYGTREKPFAELRAGDESVAVIGCLEPCRSRGPRLFREENVEPLIRDLRNRFSRVFVTPHWGKEGEFAHHPSPRQRLLARQWIEAGAAGIFGHHPHTLHGREEISGVPVYYSLGNFAFDHEEGNRYPATRLKMVVAYDAARGTFEDHLFLEAEGRPARKASDEEREFFEAVSRDLERWNLLRWARHAGPIYIPKSEASWRLRMNRDPLRTLVLRTAWNLIPVTLLLRLGSLLPDREWLSRHSAFSRRIREAS